MFLAGATVASNPVAREAEVPCLEDACLLEMPDEQASQAERYALGETGSDQDGDGVADGLDACQRSPTNLSVPRFGCRSVDAMLETVQFPFAGSGLSHQARRALEPVAATLRQYPAMIVELAAHTDDAGSERRNMRLSSRRAEAVLMHLARLGVSPARLVAMPYGESAPLTDNNEPEGKARNRRVEIYVSRADG